MAVAAAIMVALIGLGPTRLLAGPAELRAGDVAAATLSRDGLTTDLRRAEVLRAGDIITTAPDGHATLELGASRARLDGGDQASASIEASASARRSRPDRPAATWHRVGGPAVSYAVRTADVTWTADGTAFDLRLETDAGWRRTWARGIGVEHDVAISGPSLYATLDEGAVARIRLGGAPGSVADVALGPVTDADLADPWLIANARRDVAARVRRRHLRRVVSPRLDPTPSPTPDGVDLPAPTDGHDHRPAGLRVPTPATGRPGADRHASRRRSRPPSRRRPPKPTPTPKPPLATLGLDRDRL